MDWVKANLWWLWPLATGLLTSLFKPRTPEAYAAMNPRVAGILKLLGAIGWDNPNLREAAWQIATGSSKSASVYLAERGMTLPPPPPQNFPPVPPGEA